MAADTHDEYGLATLGCRAGSFHTNEDENSEAIFATSSFRFDSAAQAAARFGGEQDSNVYSRFTNPTVRAFEQRLAALEHGERGIATASGMSAIVTVVLGLLASGDHIVCSRSVFGTTIGLFTNVLPKLGITTTFVDLGDVGAWERALQPNTRLLFLETPSNPLTEIADIRALADLARANNCLLVVDNCFCTPALQRPLEMGADIVVHSATKYLDGQGRCIGGAIVTTAELVKEKFFPFLRTTGPSMSPFNAWVFLKGLETLSLRMRAHSAGALAVASWLEAHTSVKRVYYPGLASHPQHTLAHAQQTGFGGIVSFEVEGGRAAAWRVIDNLRLFTITGNLGDSRSIITHPATTTHGRLSPDIRLSMGITEGLIRLSIGLEDPDDLIKDLDRTLAN